MLQAAPRPISTVAASRAELPVLLVAGASGGGKSTFIELLRQRRLGGEILGALPDGCWTWPVIEANNMLKKRVPLDDVLASVGPADGAILHYDIAFIHRFALPAYESDPASELFRSASRLDTVLVKTDLDVLTRQHQARHAAQISSKSRAEVLWGDWVRRPLRQLSFKLQGQPAVETQTLYLTPDFLTTCYAAWEAYVRHLMLAKPASHMLTVAPAPGRDGTPAFRIVSAGP